MWWIAVGVVGVVVLRRFVPIFASVFAMGLIVAVAVWGFFAYAAGDAVGIAGANWEVPEALFYGLLLVWFGLEARTLVSEIRMRDLSKKLEEGRSNDGEAPT